MAGVMYRFPRRHVSYFAGAINRERRQAAPNPANWRRLIRQLNVPGNNGLSEIRRVGPCFDIDSTTLSSGRSLAATRR